MNPRRRLALFLAFFGLVLPQLYGTSDCSTPDPNNLATITSPPNQSTIDPSGVFTASIDFPVALTAGSLLQIVLQADSVAGETDITGQFLPSGQSDFAGATSVSADIDAVALGINPGAITLIVRLDWDGVGGASGVVVTFDFPLAGSCEDVASTALSQCFLAVSDITRLCYINSGNACDSADFTAAQGQLTADVTGACSDTEVQTLGYGSLMTAASLAARLNEECVGNAQTLSARIFGGPHAAVLSANQPSEPCMDAAYTANAAFLDTAFTAQSDCVLDEANCDPATVATDIAAARAIEAANIDTACPFELLELLVGQTADQSLALAEAQSQCMASAAHGDTAPLTLLCGSGNLPGVTLIKTQPAGLVPLDPGVPTQIMLDEAVWGTKCGDGSPYHFWVEMPPPGASAQNIHAFLQGGGACFFAECANVNANSFRSDDDSYQASGVLNPGGVNSNATLDPFTDWVKANFEYCTQDIYLGGGATQVINANLSVERYGAVNLRAGLQVLRNLVAERRNQESADGYRPDQLQVLFSGNSAGAFGVGFNLHHMIDDLRWSNTTAAAGAGTNVNNGLAALLGPLIDQWLAQQASPPYCLDSNCLIPGSALYNAHSARLLATPGQQLMVVHNQVDNTQRGTQQFGNDTAATVAHINAMRQAYCDTQGAPGVRWFLSARTQNAHSVLAADSLYLTLTADGVDMDDWTSGGRLDPTNLLDRIDEGTLETDFPGVLPFPCALP